VAGLVSQHRQFFQVIVARAHLRNFCLRLIQLRLA
jgi:hypothetical protein